MNFWTVFDILLRRWYWPVLGCLAFGGVFFVLGSKFVRAKFIATAQLQRYEAPGMSDVLKPTPISSETFASLIRAPDLLEEVAQQATPPVSAQDIAKSMRIEPEPDSDIVKVLMAAPSAQQAVDLLNVYTRKAVQYSAQLQKSQAEKLARDYLAQQVTHMDNDISDLSKQFRGLATSPGVSNKLSEIGGNLNALGQNLAAARPPSILIAKQTERLQVALGELENMLVKYTTNYPGVKQLQTEINDLESRIAAAGPTVSTSNSAPAQALAPVPRLTPTGFDPETDIIRMKLLSLEQARVLLGTKLREAEAYANNPPGNVRVLAAANLATVKSNMRSIKVGVVALFGGLFGLGLSLVLVLLAEFTDNRLKTEEDIERVTKLPLLTGLGNLNEMGPEERSQWAFRTWTLLQGRLSPSPNHGLVCGITSSAHGEGRSTWINLLAEAASLTGYRVLTIATRPSPMHMELTDDDDDEPAGQIPAGEMPTNGNGQDPTTAVATNILASPAQVTDQLMGPNSQPVVHIPLPGWVWNLERRKEWRDALNYWRTIDNLVILVELPPASVPEAVLLGSNLPNLIWLTDSGTAHAGDTRAQLETLRHARCNFAGAVVNHQSTPALRNRFPRWLEA